MKAFLLAAGLGTRLRPITDQMPKCMLPIDGQPMIDIWLEAFEKAGVDEVLVNTHYLAEVVSRHVQQRAGSSRVETFFESELFGSAGTLVANKDWVQGEDMFLACYADNLTDFDLASLIEFHRGGLAPATLTLFHAQQPSACGIVELDAEHRVVGFVEKPAHPTTDLANAGMYAFHPSILEEIDPVPPKDIGYDLLPRLVGRARAMAVEGYFRDIGTPEAYGLAQQEWRAKALR